MYVVYSNSFQTFLFGINSQIKDISFCNRSTTITLQYNSDLVTKFINCLLEQWIQWRFRTELLKFAKIMVETVELSVLKIIVFCRQLFVFFLGHCNFCPYSIYGFSLFLWYRQTVLSSIFTDTYR
jgi:hypothetical protein